MVPITGSSWDDDALQAYEAAMPGYEVVGLTGSWESTDALHCRTKGIADIGMLYIKHIPLLGNQPVQSEYTIEAEITAHSGQTIYADSVFLIYSVNSANWDSVLMTNTGGKNYSGDIPGQAFGSQIQYYLYVADQSGRNATHPFIGLPDPHVFNAGQPSLPELVVSPASIEVTLPMDESTVEQLTLENLGQLMLDYTISRQYISKSAKAYCTSSGGGGDEFIENVSIGSINNTSNQSYYADYTSISTMVEVGQSYPIVITNGDPIWSSDQCGIWVDWNQNEDFTDDEPIIVSGSPGVGPYTATILPPADALQGSARMRVQIIYAASPDPCVSSFSYGEVEDYTLEVNNNFVDWLTLNPLTGSVPGEGISTIDLSFNSTGLEEGDYYANVFINSNDPNQPEIIVPVHLNVSGARFIDLHVFLEGPFNGFEMNSQISGLSEFPLLQPYSGIPWNYNGLESLAVVPVDVVDWVLVEYRDASDAGSATSATAIGRQALLLLMDGSVVDLDGASLPSFDYSISNQLYAIVHHRNHLSIMSANPLELASSVYTFDFSTGGGQAYGTNSQNEITTGIWGMIAGDMIPDGQINNLDKTTAWELHAGLKGYHPADNNLDGEVNNNDKNEYWLPNDGKGSQIP
ncbi:MAG: GEVED domain-containing protein [Bacteroidales bacterium]